MSGISIDTFSIYWNEHRPFFTGDAAMSQPWSRTPGRIDLRAFIDGSDARVIMGQGESALLGLLREERSETGLGDISGKPCPIQRLDRASTIPPLRRVYAAHAELVAALAGSPPPTIPLDVDAVDLEDRADHLKKVFNALLIYMTAILDDTEQNVPGGLDLGNVGAALSDLASDLAGTIHLAIDAMAAGRIA
jgi:hypothetical protein